MDDNCKRTEFCSNKIRWENDVVYLDFVMLRKKIFFQVLGFAEFFCKIKNDRNNFTLSTFDKIEFFKRFFFPEHLVNKIAQL